jgi:hypothetical protein
VFIDASLPDAVALAEGFGGQMRVVMLEPGTDPWVQLTNALQLESGVQAVHLVTHGDGRALVIAGQAYDAGQLALRAELLQTWREHLTSSADLLLYGCELGAEGTESPLLRLLAETTGADVAASVDTTAPVAQGGNTVLEVATGPIEASSSALAGLAHTLAATSISDANSGATRTTQEDTELAISGLSIADADSPANLMLRVQTSGGTARIATLGSATVSSGSNGSRSRGG